MSESAKGPWGAEPEGVRCDFVDGKTAQRHLVYATWDDSGTQVELRQYDDGEEVRCWIWSLEDMRYVEGQRKLRWGQAPFGVYTHLQTPAARLYVRDTRLLQDLERRAPNLAQRPPVQGRGRLLGLIGGAVASVVLIVFVLIPLIADQLATILPVEGERALGDKTYEQVRTAFSQGYLPIRECLAEDGAAALQVMEDRLVAASDLTADAVTLSVLDFDMVNAFALPGGRIVVMRGLIDEAETPDEVAAVIAHEIGHVAHRDPTRHALRSVGTFGVLSLVLGDFAGGSVVLLGANQLVNAQYSQGAESAADAYAHDLLPRAGVSPAALAPLFERLKEAYGDSEGLAAHLSSHPQLGDRVTRARAAAEGYKAAKKAILTPDEWRNLRNICRF
nr:M48 family metallopeptidase [uncultured Celeribacter sp.]